MRTIYFTLFFLLYGFIYSQTFANNTHNKTIEEKPAIKQQAPVKRINITKDSCEKWGVPITNFSFSYSGDYEIDYFADQSSYLRLTEKLGGTMTKSITFSRFYGSFETLTNDSVSLDLAKKLGNQLAESKYGISKAQFGMLKVNGILRPATGVKLFIDEENEFNLQGYYTMYAVLFVPSYDGINGVSITIATKRDKTDDSFYIDSEDQTILKGFSFE